jgi:L-lactate dehydrogenase complex protein LldG
MSSKKDILYSLKRNIGGRYDMPDIGLLEGIIYPDPLEKFIEVSKAVGGDALVLKPEEDINVFIKSHYPEAKTIASNLREIKVATFDPDQVEDPHTLNGTDLAIVRGEIGVAENGCVWIPQNVKHKGIYFIAEYLVIVLDKTKVVNNMHEAYRQINFGEKGFGVFISGPSKTADIEQALVVGAHGAKGVTVILR